VNPVRSLCLAAVAFAAACATTTAPAAVGTWGGTEASVALTRSGGTVSYACGMGTIDASWTLAADGRFAATGVHYLGGGPVPAGGGTPHPAVYSGLVSGDRFEFTVTLTDLGQTLGPFHMVRDGPVVLEICV
jgi:hypothetical protein